MGLFLLHQFNGAVLHSKTMTSSVTKINPLIIRHVAGPHHYFLEQNPTGVRNTDVGQAIGYNDSRQWLLRGLLEKLVRWPGRKAWQVLLQGLIMETKHEKLPPIDGRVDKAEHALRMATCSINATTNGRLMKPSGLLTVSSNMSTRSGEPAS